MADLTRLAKEETCQLTTTGRRTGKAHEIQICFVTDGARLFVFSGRGDGSDWVKNLRQNPAVSVRIGAETISASAEVVGDDLEVDRAARDMFDRKYHEWEPGKPHTEWVVKAMPVELKV